MCKRYPFPLFFYFSTWNLELFRHINRQCGFFWFPYILLFIKSCLEVLFVINKTISMLFKNSWKCLSERGIEKEKERERLLHVAHIPFLIADLEEGTVPALPTISKAHAIQHYFIAILVIAVICQIFRAIGSVVPCCYNRDISEEYDPSVRTHSVKLWKRLCFLFISKVIPLFVLMIPIVMTLCIFKNVDLV